MKGWEAHSALRSRPTFRRLGVVLFFRSGRECPWSARRELRLRFDYAGGGFHDRGFASALPKTRNQGCLGVTVRRYLAAKCALLNLLGTAGLARYILAHLFRNSCRVAKFFRARCEQSTAGFFFNPVRFSIFHWANLLLADQFFCGFD